MQSFPLSVCSSGGLILVEIPCPQPTANQWTEIDLFFPCFLKVPNTRPLESVWEAH